MIVGWVIVVLASLILGWRMWQRYDQHRRAFQRRGGRPVPPRSQPPGVRSRRVAASRASTMVQVRSVVTQRGTAGMTLFGLIIVVLLLLIYQLSGFGRSSQADSTWTVLVAPFMTPAGEPAPEGASVAQSLAYAWSTESEQRLNRPVRVRVIDQTISSPEEALRAVQRHQADAIIWGRVEAGGAANLTSLYPELLLFPRTALWYEQHPGLQERLILPPVYSLAYAPLNGAAVVGPIIDLLDMMRVPEPDLALQQINLLLDRYAGNTTLRADLLYALRGIIELMQDQPVAAELDFRRALEESPRPEYWNNLAVALDMQGRQAEAVDILNTAIVQADQRLAQPFYNRGLITLQGLDPAAALPDLRQAHLLHPDGVYTLLALAEAQRRANQLDDALASVSRAHSLAPNQPLVDLIVAKVQFAQLLNTGAYIPWELEIAPALSRQPLTTIRERLDLAVAGLEQLALINRQQAASADAAGWPEIGRVYESRAHVYDGWLEEARYWRALTLTEEGIVEQRERPGGLRGVWNGLFGDDPPLRVAQNILQQLVNEQTSHYDYRVLLGRVLYLQGATATAEEQFRSAIEINSTRPEAWFGLAKVFADQSDSPERDQQLRDALTQAIAADERFVPAYVLLARFEMQQRNWAAALPPLLWLVDHRPDLTSPRLRLGIVQRELGLLAEAEQTLLPLANAGNSTALVELAKVYIAADQLDVAETVLKRALRLAPQHATAAYELGVLYQRKGMFVEAEASYRNAVVANPDYLEAHVALGRLYSQVLGEPDQAVQAYQQAIEAGGNDARSYEELGQAFWELGEYQQAVNALNRSIALNPNVPEVYHLLAQSYLELGRYEAAREQERAAIARTADGVYVEAQTGIAESFRRQGLYDEAIAAFNTALDQDPAATGAYVGLGRTAADRQDWQTAIGYYNQALGYDPNNPEAHLALGQALVEQGFYGRSLEEFEQVLLVEPTNADAYYGAGRAYNQLATLETDPQQQLEYQRLARAMLNAALQQRPSFGQALLERGILNEYEGLTEAAIADYASAARLLESSGMPAYLLGKLYLSQNNVEAATEALQNAVARDPNSAGAHYWLGRAYRASSRTSGALQVLNRALELDAGYTEARYYKALTLQENNQPLEAREEYEVILAQTDELSLWHQQAEERLRELDAQN